MQLPGKFEPWKKERAFGLKLAACGLFSAVVAAGFAIKGDHWIALGFAVVALGLAKAGVNRCRRANNREFGKAFEEDSIERAAHELIEHGFMPRSNVMARGLGDIDLVVYRGRKRLPVEVKSFRKWNQFLMFNGEREKRALIQADRQRRALKSAHGIVWLPQGRPTIFQRVFGAGSNNIVVVFGNERALVRAVKGMI